jgi:hypothetical protein
MPEGALTATASWVIESIVPRTTRALSAEAGSARSESAAKNAAATERGRFMRHIVSGDL